MKTIGIALLVLLTGCAQLSDPAVIRVIEYGSGGAVGLVSGEVGGCSVYQQEGGKPATTSIAVVYNGEKCQVRAISK